MNLQIARSHYRTALTHTDALIADLDESAIMWRPHENSSAIAWHLGHTAAVGHFLMRNLTAAEPSIDQRLDALFDSASPEPDRGSIPPLAALLEYRTTALEQVDRGIERIATGNVGAPDQLSLIAVTMLTALVNHEYQHDTWIAEVRATLGADPVPVPSVGGLTVVEGYPILGGSQPPSPPSRES